MDLAQGLEAIDLPMQTGTNAGTIFPLLAWNDRDGATLVDTGLPGSLPGIEAHLRRLGLSPRDLRRIILTHQDIDHIGSARAVAEASGAEVIAHADDVPWIQGERPLLKHDPKRMEERLAAAPPEHRERMRSLFEHPPSVKVGRTVTDGERLDLHGGIIVIHTPGHTPGHISLFFPAERLLVSGDALRVVDGELTGPSPSATPDMPRAMESVRKLLDLPIERVLCYHGGLSKPGAGKRLREIVGAG